MKGEQTYWDEPWNPVVGCTKASPGCLNCWAEIFHNRFHKGKNPKGQFKKPFHEIQLFPDRKIPSGKGKTVFVCNTSDLFHPKTEQPGIDFPKFVIGTISATHNQSNRYLLLTKRPDRMASWFGRNVYREPTISDWKQASQHIWFGTTCEDQKRADERSEFMKRIPGKIWYSFEPQLGLIDRVPIGDWAVVGSESGKDQRFHYDKWARIIVEAYQRAGKPVFVKQLQINGKCVHDWGHPDYPDNLKIREFPWDATP